jgi:DNA-binding NarL/FixJ family response regulator
MRCVGAYASAEAALAELPSQMPEVVLMDINLPGMSGIETVRRLKVLAPAAQVMMVTVFDDTSSVFESLKAGPAATSSSGRPSASCWPRFATSLPAARR